MIRELKELTSGIPQIKNVFIKLNTQLPSNWTTHSYTVSEYPLSFVTELNVWALGGSGLQPFLPYMPHAHRNPISSNMSLYKVPNSK